MLELFKKISLSRAPKLFLAVCLTLLSPAALSAAQQELLAEVSINGTVDTDVWALLQRDDGFYAPAEALISWRLLRPRVAPVMMGGVSYYPLSAIAGLTYEFDPMLQALTIHAPAGSFVRSELDIGTVPRPRAEALDHGAFLNYDIQGSWTGASRHINGTFEGVMFGPYGVLTSTYLSRDLGQERQFVRLDTTYFKDFPDSMTGLSLGDVSSARGRWARQVRYGGIKWGSRYDLRPGTHTLPLPTAAGEAVHPSVVDVYVNNVFQMRHEVQPGPFAIHHLPVVSGAGDIRLIVRDVLGREQIYSQRYFTSSRLLGSEMHEFDWDLGTIREQYAVKDDQYGQWFGATTHRYGLSHNLTLDVRGEMYRGGTTMGAGATWRTGYYGTLGGALATSRAGGKRGILASVELDTTLSPFNFFARLDRASPEFRQLGLGRDEHVPATVLTLQGTVRLFGSHGLSMGYVNRRPRVARKQETVNFGYSGQFSSVSVSVSAIRTLGDRPSTGIMLALTVPLSQRRLASLSTNSIGGRQFHSAQFQQSLPYGNGNGNGFGYSLRVDQNELPAYRGALQYQNNYGRYEVEMSERDEDRNYRVNAKGAIALMRATLLPSREIRNSFAYVDAGRKGVDVWANNHRVGATDERGLAIVPDLLAYERNVVRIDDRGLPIEVSVDLGERVFAPARRSGVYLKFGSKVVQGVTLKLVGRTGEPLPIGSRVTLQGQAGSYMIAMRGEVYIDRIEYPAVVAVDTDSSKCRVRVPPPGEMLPVLGPLTCEETSQ